MSLPADEFDVAVVGGGIVGLGVAWAAQRMGMKTVLFERNQAAVGASIRNFGMLWPIGQPAGERRQLALRNRELWLELADQSQLWLEKCGSLHLAHHRDEWLVLQEFANLSEEVEQHFELLTPTETCRRTKLARHDGLYGSLYSPHECRVAPRQAIPVFAAYLKQLGVKTYFGEPIVAVNGGTLTSATDKSWHAEHVFVCSGADFANLYPAQHVAAQLRPCKLHMLRTRTLETLTSIGPHLASGLTLRHYESFSACKSWDALRRRVACNSPELEKFGIHVLVSQDAEGHLVLGDSHEYGLEIDPFDNTEIEALILRELKKVYDLPTWEVDARWTGTYSQCTNAAWCEMNPAPNVTIVNGFGGAGMSLSLAVTERVVNRLFDSARAPTDWSQLESNAT